ncbi:MAG: hypothetical protein EA439_01295 [Nitrosopumilus sp.]|nr:MAG: hypothetical protein EA439_01295 [Nitrosopumilus sp.]
MEDYKSFLEVLMVSNKNIRFSAICSLDGELLFQKRREDVKELFSLEETKKQLNQTIESWKTRAEIKDKIGNPLYSVTSYEKIKRMTISIDSEHLLFISMDNKNDEVEMLKKIDMKNISALLDIGLTTS